MAIQQAVPNSLSAGAKLFVVTKENKTGLAPVST